MDSPFPWGLPAPTGFYLVVYLVTFAIHQVCMHYVLAGSIYVAWATIAAGGGSVRRAEQPLGAELREWMPFGLSAAITAGVAPLLFVQIVYPRHFYTANLLLSWRWMVVVPVLIVAFYLLYLVKSRFFSRWPYAARVAVVALVAASFLFVGFCWTANHLISSHEADWPQIYASGHTLLSGAAVGLRMLVWVGGACASVGVIAGWQLIARGASIERKLLAQELRRLAYFSLGGLSMASAAGGAYLMQNSESVRALMFGAFARPYLIATVVGVSIQTAAWVQQLRRGPRSWPLLAAAAGCLVTLLSVSVLRESVRLASVDISLLYQRHAQAGEIGGLGLFLLFAIVNAALIAGCIWLVRRGLARAQH